MNIADARVVLRPRTHGEILDLAARWCFNADRALYARLSAAVLLPSLTLCIAARWMWEWSWLEVWLLAAGLTTVTQGVFTVATSQALFRRDVRATDVLRRWLRRLPSYLGALIITRVILAVGAVTLVLLPVAWVRVAMVHEASLLEGSGATKATERAWQLAKYRGTDMVLMLGGLGLCVIGGVAVAELLGHGVVEIVLQLGRPLGELVEDGGSLYALLGFHAAIPFVAVARFLAYVDQRTRGDGWDLQLRFMALANEAARLTRRVA